MGIEEVWKLSDLDFADDVALLGKTWKARISLSTKMRIYSAVVIPILFNNQTPRAAFGWI